jgi:acetyl-CoA synthetase
LPQVSDYPPVDRVEPSLAAGRTFPPRPELARHANAQPGIHALAEADPLAFWRSWADRLEWDKVPQRILDWDEPFARWFADGELNASVNALDRHIRAGYAARVAYYYEGEPGDRRTITYGELLDEVCRFANGLRALGVNKGDRVAIYLPMILELPIAMLACARIGAAHSVIFGGFAPEAIVERVNDAQCVALITADAGWRGGKKVPLKHNCDQALAKGMPSLAHVIVAQRVGDPVPMVAGRDRWWADVVRDQLSICRPERMNAEDLLFLLYTSGTTAKPKGIMHTTAGYLTGVTATHELVFDHKAGTDVYWCAEDIGWITGHSYAVYGPLCNGATSVMYEGTPDFPALDRPWEIVERYGVTILYTTPTAIRTFMKWGPAWPRKHDLSSLRILALVGEPIGPDAWLWYRDVIGGGRCPVLDTWWQTETGAITIAPLPGVSTLKPGSASQPFPGIAADVVNGSGEPVAGPDDGFLVLTRPWPAMLRGIYGDPDRYVDTYWTTFYHQFLAGDGCRRDADGDFWFTGRIDDVMNVSGHRVSATEVESALMGHAAVAEVAVVGKADELTGQSIAAFVTVRGEARADEALGHELRQHVAEKLGTFVAPKSVTFTTGLPKTRSGKVMRRLLRDIAEGRAPGDTTTLADPEVVAGLRTPGPPRASEEE